MSAGFESQQARANLFGPDETAKTCRLQGHGDDATIPPKRPIMATGCEERTVTARKCAISGKREPAITILSALPGLGYEGVRAKSCRRRCRPPTFLVGPMVIAGIRA